MECASEIQSLRIKYGIPQKSAVGYLYKPMALFLSFYSVHGRISIIKIGAGTGRYSHALARQGYTVDAVELVPHNIEIFRQNTQPGETITITQGNAMDLAPFPDSQYDITLLLGPL